MQNYNLTSVKQLFNTSLSAIYPAEEIQTFFKICTKKLLNLSTKDIYLYQSLPVNNDVFKNFSQIIKRLQAYEPIQYILEETEFYGLKLKVTPAVLIPRPETEELVQLVIKETESDKDHQILDIGTGSGCIAIALKKNLKNCILDASDISLPALTIAQHNATLNNTEITFLHDDIFNTTITKKYSVIISNPPYVRENEKEQMSANVLNFEPPSALFVTNENPLIYYQAICNFAINHLLPGGTVYVEINENLAYETAALFQQHTPNPVEIIQDIHGKNRIIKSKF